MALLRVLRAASAHASGGDLAAQIGAPVSAVEERIAELQQAGFEIEDRPGSGYRLLASPDRLIADDLRARLGENRLIREIIVFEKTGSTNDSAAHLGRSGAASGVVILAEKQSTGRGRFGRRWASASHLGLWFSLLLRPELPFANWPRLTTWAAVAIVAAIEETVGARASIKWPNDVLLSRKKVAGILMETGADDAQRPFAVLGIGLNVNHAPEDFPAELAANAGSLRETAGCQLDRAEIAVSIFRHLDRRFGALQSSFETLIEEATRRSLLLGGWIQVRAGDSLLEGIAEALDPDGHLLLRLTDGSVQVLSSGEVTLSAPKNR